jgi:hypothetical protein
LRVKVENIGQYHVVINETWSPTLYWILLDLSTLYGQDCSFYIIFYL